MSSIRESRRGRWMLLDQMKCRVAHTLFCNLLWKDILTQIKIRQVFWNQSSLWSTLLAMRRHQITNLGDLYKESTLIRACWL